MLMLLLRTMQRVLQLAPVLVARTSLALQRA
jgi:hypothetical protein